MKDQDDTSKRLNARLGWGRRLKVRAAEVECMRR